MSRMHSSNRRGGGRHFNKSRFHNNPIKKYKPDVVPERLTEKDVGITEYISDLKGFSGILKARFSDFQVNEINSNGEVAKFTNTTEPEGFDQILLKKDLVIPKDTPCPDIPQDIWTEILAVVDSDEGKIIELECTDFDKEKRGSIHRTVKSILQQKVVASTIEKDGKKYITFKKYNKEEKQDNRILWPIDKEEFVYFLVYKENIDTLEAALRISDYLHIKASAFSYAGVKDRRAKTTQWFSVRKVEPWKLLRKTRGIRNIHIGNITFKDKPLKLGKLQGNRFRIALRNVTAEDDLINESMESLKEKGFVNYYGLQRFGNDKEVPTYEIGIKLLLGQFKEACNLILKCKECDNPAAEISQAKKLYSETGNAADAVKLLNHRDGNSVESKLLQGLANSNVNDYVTALESLPRNARLLYIHGFQALIWNKMVSRRIKEFGFHPVAGDLVLVKDDENAASDEADVDETKEADEENDNEEAQETEPSKKKNVKVLTQDDLKNYSIYDIVLPLPGYDVVYPENLRESYKEVLEEHGLTLEMPKQSVKTYTLSGTYRSVVQKVENLSWKVMHYDDPNGDLIRSDFEEFLNKPEPVDKSGGQFKALIIDFYLNSCCYATMVVREILKTDTSATAHTKLNDYHSKREVPKITVQETEQQTLDSPAVNSLLLDPAKYEDFKKSIFGVTSNNDPLKRKIDDKNDDCTVPEKKSKEDEESKDSGLKIQPSLV